MSENGEQDKDKHIPIHAWNEDDQPREKLLNKGKSTLSNAEIIAILINSGYREKSAVQLSREILKAYGDSLESLGRATVLELMKFKGIGEAKAISIAAALELGRRKRDEDTPEIKRINVSSDAWKFLYPFLADAITEEFHIILLKRNQAIIRSVPISTGGVTGTVVDAKVIFKHALLENAVSLVLCHNHPSGNTQPSNEDINLTKKIVSAGKLLDISVVDHIIFTNKEYYSFADNGLI